ncbi:MAG: single-stranded DNA-binding protein [Blastocatellia bacterium]|nr:single-stranded DNA-binding protein [Blastocatellia bacterium]
MSFNKIIIVGYLGRDPDMRYTSQNVPVCSFNVATTERKKDGRPGEAGGETTTWFRVTFWREKAELANKYLAKGRQVYVEGRLSTKEWKNRDGVTQTSLEVTGTELHFIDNKSEGGGGSRSESFGRSAMSAPGPASEPDEGSDLNEDDIPF